MRLKNLTLQGYKSFAAKTEFLFPTGITAIVGPNGSGKSNVADSIRWALGERSMHALRGKTSADMIFIGGQRRARAGMAEASLTLDNSDGWLPIEFSEVTIARRAYRSGDNEYLINGAKVRLRDITELLAESGLSERTYTVMGQGAVDAALALRPDERRNLFEEAAGISLHRSKREKSVERLDETQHNLERVQDIIKEIAPRLQRLEVEAEQVEQHRRVEEHLERLQRTWYGYQWGRQQTVLDEALEKTAFLESALETQRQKAAALGERLAQLRQQESKLRSQLRDWHRESADLHDQANEMQRELAVAEERARLLKLRRKELLEEIEPLEDQQRAQVEKITQIQTRVEQLERELTERKERLITHEQEWEAAKKKAQESKRQRVQVEQDLRSHRTRLEHLNQNLREGQAEVSQLASERAVAKEHARQLQSRRAEVLAELEPLDSQQKAQAEKIAQAQAQVERKEHQLNERQKNLAEMEQERAKIRQKAQEPDPRRARLEQELRDQRARLERLEQRLLDARAEAARLAGEQETLARMHAAGAAYNTGVQTLLQAELEGVLGPLATLIQASPRWEQALEAALGADLQAVVVENLTVAKKAYQMLESAGGRLTLLPLSDLHPPPALPSEVASAADVINCDAQVRQVVEAVLGTVALCDDLAEARALLPALPPGGCCVTPKGLVLQANGALSVGESRGQGILADERALKELPGQLEETHQRCQAIEERRQTEIKQIADGEAKLEELARQAAAAREKAARVWQEKLGQARTDAAVAKEALRSQQAALEREVTLLEQLEAQETNLHEQADKLKAEHAAIAPHVQELHAEAPMAEAQSDEATEEPLGFQSRLEKVQRRCQQIEGRQSAETEQIAALETRLEKLSRQAIIDREEVTRIERETVSQSRTEVAVAEESLHSRQATLKRETSLLEGLEAQINARRRRAEELKTEQTAIIARTQKLQVSVSETEAQLRQVQGRIQPAEESLTRSREDQTALEKQRQRAQDRVREADARHSRAQLEIERRRGELKSLAQRIEENLGLVELELTKSVTAQTPLPMRPLVSQLPVVEELPEGLEEEIQRLKARLRRLGRVNPNAPQNYAEVQERHQFLTEQSADLEKASARLRQVVAELDELMEAAFQEIFDEVATKFSKLFTTLFNGGSARLELTEPDDMLNTGVDIIAQPPKKRAQRLALLSGGERSLTAVALLFSILYVSPTPFCVLDEVDAMLDEANVGRFRALLEDLARQTQFIIITHNRGTIEVADTVYGISMGADGVSQVVSLKLDED